MVCVEGIVRLLQVCARQRNIKQSFPPLNVCSDCVVTLRKGGGLLVLDELVVDLSNGIVQDFVLREAAIRGKGAVAVVESDVRLGLSDEGL